MRLKRISKFSRTVTKGLLPTQQATLSQVVCGMLYSRCLILAEIARGFETVVEFVHNLKRVFRSVDNERLTQHRAVRRSWRVGSLVSWSGGCGSRQDNR